MGRRRSEVFLAATTKKPCALSSPFTVGSQESTNANSLQHCGRPPRRETQVPGSANFSRALDDGLDLT